MSADRTGAEGGWGERKRKIAAFGMTMQANGLRHNGETDQDDCKCPLCVMSITIDEV